MRSIIGKHVYNKEIDGYVQLEQVEHRFDRIGMRKISFAKFIMDTGQSIAIGFSPNHSKDSEAVFAWLAKQLGKEKVGR